jgi:hypothetical protein
MYISFITMNRFVEERIESDLEYRQRFDMNRGLLSHGRTLSDESLLDKLRTIAFPLDRPQFLALSERFVSAEEMARFVYQEKPSIPDKDHDWIWIAFTCLWERWQPGRLSLEMIDDRMQDGYKTRRGHKAVDTCNLWIAAWDGIWHLIETQHICSVEEFDSRFPLTQCLFNWVQDFVSELNAAGVENETYLQKRLVVLNAFLARLQCDELIRSNFQSDLAETCFLLGVSEKGEELFRQFLRDKPKWGWGWIRWADCYSLSARSGEQDFAKAEQILKQGLEIPAVEDKQYLLERLEELYSETGRSEDAEDVQKEIETLANASRTAIKSRAVIPNNSISSDVPMSPRTGISGLSPLGLGMKSLTSSKKTGRNNMCPCGSGKKFKRCCYKNGP